MARWSRTKADPKTDFETRMDFRLAHHFFNYFITPRMVALRGAWNTMVRFTLEDDDFVGLVPEEFFVTQADGRRVLSYHTYPTAEAAIQVRFGFLVDMLGSVEQAKAAGPFYLAARDAAAHGRTRGLDMKGFLHANDEIAVVLPNGSGAMTLRWLGSLWGLGYTTVHLDERFAGHPTVLKLAAFNRERVAHREQFDQASRFLQEEMTDMRNDNHTVFSMCAVYPDMRETFKLVFGDMESSNKKTTAGEQLYPKRGADTYNIRASGAQYLDSAAKRERWVETRDVLMRATLAHRTPEKSLLPGESEFFQQMRNA